MGGCKCVHACVCVSMSVRVHATALLSIPCADESMEVPVLVLSTHAFLFRSGMNVHGRVGAFHLTRRSYFINVMFFFFFKQSSSCRGVPALMSDDKGCFVCGIVRVVRGCGASSIPLTFFFFERKKKGSRVERLVCLCTCGKLNAESKVRLLSFIFPSPPLLSLSCVFSFFFFLKLVFSIS